MKKIFKCFCLAVIMLLSFQGFSQNLISASQLSFVPARVTLVGDGFEIVDKCDVHFDVDTLYNTANFMIKRDGNVSEMVNFHIDYVTCSQDSGFVLHMNYNTVCYMEKCDNVTCCKLVMYEVIEDFEKVIFLFYLE